MTKKTKKNKCLDFFDHLTLVHHGFFNKKITSCSQEELVQVLWLQTPFLTNPIENDQAVPAQHLPAAPGFFR